MNAEGAMMIIPEQNKVANFDPRKFLRKSKDGLKLELKYKKLWFRLKYPSGRIKLYPLKVTDQMAIIEARVYLNKEDAEPEASFIAKKDTANSPGGLYIEAAQYAAVDQALADAGFDIQFVQQENSAAPDLQITPTVSEVSAGEKAATKPAAEIRTAPTPTMETASENVETPVIEEDADTENLTADVEISEQEPAFEMAASTVGGELTTADEESAAELREVFEEAEEAVDRSAYTKDMPVETICSMMTLEEAGNVIVPVGTCKGWTLSQVADRRKASLKWYINGYNGDDNILRAAASIMQDNLMQQAS